MRVCHFTISVITAIINKVDFLINRLLGSLSITTYTLPCSTSNSMSTAKTRSIYRVVHRPRPSLEYLKSESHSGKPIGLILNSRLLRLLQSSSRTPYSLDRVVFGYLQSESQLGNLTGLILKGRHWRLLHSSIRTPFSLDRVGFWISLK